MALTLMGVGYFAWAWLSVILARQPGNLAVLWFANAWAVGIILCRPRREAPLLLALQAVSNSFVSILYGDPLNILLAFSACNVVEVALSTALLSRYFNVEQSLNAPEAFLKVFVVGALIPSAVGATLGSITLGLAGLASVDSVWLGWFMGGVFGYAAFASLILFFLYHSTIEKISLPSAKDLVFLVLSMGMIYFIQRQFSHPYSLSLAVMVMMLIWAPPFEGALANLALGVLTAYVKSIDWRKQSALGENHDLIQELLPALAVLFVFSVLLAYVKAGKLANQKLEQRERFIRSVTDSIPGMVGYWDSTLHNRFANYAYLDWFGKSPKEMAGMHIATLLGPELYQRNLSYIEGALRGQHQTFFRTLRKADGSLHHSRAEYIPDEIDGIVHGFVVLVTDVTEIEKSKADALAANEAKSAFLASMSHEIRTPLNAIVGTSYLMGLSELSPEQKSDLEIISSSSKNLLALVNDVLDFSKIEAGELEIENRPFSLTETLQDLRVQFSGMAARKGLELVFELNADNVPPVLLGDDNRLKQILINLLNNAIKFTGQGGVNLSVSVCPSSTSTSPRLCFKVSDTGIGISEEAQGYLFEPFKQADTSTTREYGGTGLGLSIVKRLVELMGGEIRLRSKIGQGSVFEFELPFGVSDLTELSASTQYTSANPLHILVAEDDPIDHRLMIQMCADFGWQLESVSNGFEMVALVKKRLDQNQPIDCIIVDWWMPVLNGLEALKKLKQDIGTECMPSVVMVTANDRSALEQAIQDIRPDDILTKPLDPSILFNAVNTAVIAHGHGLSHVLNATILRGAHVHWLLGIRIMVVDDNSMNLDVIRRILVSEGAEVILCESGEAALARLQELYEQGLQLDAVLMDMQMPNMDGCETTLKIRQFSHFDKLPIITLTAGATTTEKQRALDAGMNDFLTKPVDPVRLVRVLRACVEKARGRPLSLGLSGMPQQSADEAIEIAQPKNKQQKAWPLIAGINGEFASLMMGGDVEFFREMLQRFLTEHRDTLNQIQALISEGKMQQAASLAHKLKGQAGNLGAEELHQAAGVFEQAILDKQENLDDVFKVLRQKHDVLF